MKRSESSRSIIDRISSIRQYEDKWKERVPKASDELTMSRPESVYVIQEKLQTTQGNWKTRIEQSDVNQFTTAAKLLSVQHRDDSLRHSFHENTLKDINRRNICVVRLMKSTKIDQSPPKFTLRSSFTSSLDDNMVVVADNQCNDNRTTLSTDDNMTLFDKNNQQQVHSHKVIIPQMSDQSLSNFFKSSSDASSNHESTLVDMHTTDDFDDIFLQTDLNLNIPKRTTKPHRKTRTTSSKNPIKILNERQDIVGEYEETIYGVADRELRRCKVVNIQSKAGYAEEALAGLSSKEDFSKVKLRRNESANRFEHFVSPYKDVMLILVKGRKKVQLRLVEPVASSINCGDCYLLVTSSRVFVWQGICANIIEVSKANDLGLWIAKYKDLNYKGYGDKPTIVKSNDSVTNANVIQFWSTLKYDKVQLYNNPGISDEDEIYEQRIQTTNMVFEVIGHELIPVEEYWGRLLKHKLLTDNKVFIFDFGSELYLWTGNKADNAARSHGKALLRQLWAKAFDYDKCAINPLDPLPEFADNAKPTNGPTRPDWTIVGRLPQRGETILFKEKFSDWPESSRLIKYDNGKLNNNLDKKIFKCDLQPADLDQVLKLEHPSVHLTIDGKNVGRGGHWKVIEDGILREFDICTKNIEIWHILNNEAVKIDESSMGQFCSGDAYIIRWDFELKTLGRFKKTQTSGNLSSAFFFWQGTDTSVTEKTASALHTIDLDKDKVTQIRVKQHNESPAFCRLFDGAMIIHQGKRKNVQEKKEVRLFIVRGENASESHFVEVKCESESLRARSSFLLLNTVTGNGYVWVGRLSSDQSRLCAHYCVQSLNRRKPSELGLYNNVDIKVEEIKQGEEHRSFWQDLGAIKKRRCCNSSVDLTPIKGWLVSGVTNSFDLIQLKYSLNNDGGVCIPAFPLLQSMLYKATQPALLIIWNLPHVYLWQGWWPHLSVSSVTDSDSDVDDSVMDHDDWAMPKNRIAAEKLATLKSISYYLEKHISETLTASIVYAGLEPLAFTELFPFWEINETAKIANIKKGYRMYQEDDIPQTLAKYLTEKFSVTQLRTHPLPECVVLSKIEWYLHDNEFENLFQMSKEEFYEMTPWKQREKKKEVNLF